MECLICSGSIKSFLGFPSHLSRKHKIKTKQYYDRFYASGSIGLCVICSGSTSFINLQHGYREFCSHECADVSDLVRERRKTTTLERFGVENVFQSEEKKKKSRETLIERYGVDHPMRSDVIVQRLKETNLERHGNEWQIASSGTRASILESFQEKFGCDNPFGNPDVQAKIELTNIERYGAPHPVNQWVQNIHGVTCALKIPGKLEETKRTNLEKYGVEWISQDPEILRRAQSSAYRRSIVDISGSIFSCQGYEEFFLRNCENFGLSAIDLTDRVPSISYEDISSKRRRYIPDFIHIPTGAVVEIKSTWTYDGCGSRVDWKENNKMKMLGTFKSGRDFHFVVFDSSMTCVSLFRDIKDFDGK